MLRHVKLHRLGALLLSPPRIEQEQLVVSVRHVLVGGVVVGEPFKGGGGEGEVLQVVLLNHAGVVEAVHNYSVGRLARLLCKGNLCQVISPFVRVGRQGVGSRLLLVVLAVRFERVAHGLQRILGGIVVALIAVELNNGVVRSPPVVLVLTLAPTLLEVLLALRHEHRVVEVPLLVALRGVGRCRSRRIVRVATLPILFEPSLCGRVAASLALLRLLLAQRLDYAVDGSVALRLRHTSQSLQTVLQIHSRRVRHQFVQHLGTACYLLVVGAFLVEQAYGLRVARLRLVELTLVPVHLAQAKQQHALL